MRSYSILKRVGSCGAELYGVGAMRNMALKEEGYPVSVWDHWARNPARYKEGECSRKWKHCRSGDDIVTGGTIFQICKDKGVC